MAKPKFTLAQRFWQKVNKTNKCWLWTACKLSTGYGYFCIQSTPRVVTLAHRFSYEYYYGKIPQGMFCLHKCDTPLCVKPDHLFIGTHTDNMRDMFQKERRDNSKVGRKGVNHHNTKLTDTKVILMREMYATGQYSYADIALLFSLERSTVWGIIRRKAWKHIL